MDIVKSVGERVPLDGGLPREMVDQNVFEVDVEACDVFLVAKLKLKVLTV